MSSEESLQKKESNDVAAKTGETEYERRDVQWFSTLWHLHLHLFALYGVCLVFTQAKLVTLVYLVLLCSLTLLGVTAGVHRLWAHRTYKASLPLRIFLMLCQTATLTGSIYDWVLTHRVHHKFYGTKDDPFNHKRGFLYAHLQSRFCTRGSNWDKLTREVDMKDLEEESLVMFQNRFYWLLAPLVTLVLSASVPIGCWGESGLVASLVVFALRCVIITHLSWCVTSGILIWGLRKENNFSRDTNLVFFVDLSFWPHYHYLAPWDYQCGEFGTYAAGCTTALIRAWVAMGWASDLLTVDTDGVRRALERSVDEKRDMLSIVEEEGRKFSEKLREEHLVRRPVHIF